MMKWILAVLVLVNIGVGLWISGYVPPPEAVEAPRATVHAEKMRLLTERGVALKPRPKPPEPILETEAGSATPLLACYRAGPFAELESVVQAGKRLEERQVAYMRREESRQAVTGYRVYLPPFPSRQAAEARRKELTRLGFKDHALIQDGGRYAISLGLYTIEANARDHLKQLAVKGIVAKLDPIQQRRTAYWLELTGADLFDVLQDFDWREPGVSLSEFTCPATVAPMPTDETPPADAP